MKGSDRNVRGGPDGVRVFEDRNARRHRHARGLLAALAIAGAAVGLFTTVALLLGRGPWGPATAVSGDATQLPASAAAPRPPAEDVRVARVPRPAPGPHDPARPRGAASGGSPGEPGALAAGGPQPRSGAAATADPDEQAPPDWVTDLVEELRTHDGSRGIAVFPPRGTNPPKTGLVVPDDFELPEGYMRYHQVTDDGQRLEPILMFSPDYEFVDQSGRRIEIPANGIVPPELAPPGLPLRMLVLPEDPRAAAGTR